MDVKSRFSKTYVIRFRQMKTDREIIEPQIIKQENMQIDRLMQWQKTSIDGKQGRKRELIKP